MNQTFKKYLSKAKKGDIDSQYELASMYQFGRDTSIDLKEAIKWYKKAADQGHPSALSMLKALKGTEERYEPLNEELDRDREEKRNKKIRKSGGGPTSFPPPPLQRGGAIEKTERSLESSNLISFIFFSKFIIDYIGYCYEFLFAKSN